MTFDTITIVVLFLCFIWSGFVRAGFGAGAFILMLPFALFVINTPLIIVPVVATHAVILSSLTVFQHFHNVNWKYVGVVISITFIPFISGLYGLILLSEKWLVLLVYGITLIYALSYIFPRPVVKNTNPVVKKTNSGFDFLMLMIGGYINGLSFTGGPPIAAVMTKYVPKQQFRDTFLATVILTATTKLSTFFWLGISLQPQLQLIVIPAVLLGHVMGLRFHRYFVTMDERIFYRWLGIVLLMVTLLGIIKTLIFH